MSRRISRPLVALAATLLATSMLVVGGLSASAEPGTLAPTDARATPVKLRVGSYNIQASRSQADFEKAVNEFKPRVDVAGLQEIAGHIRNNWLMADHSWRIFRGSTVGQVSVIWRPEVMEFISGKEVKLSDAATIEGKGGGLIQKKAEFAPVVRLRHVPTGEEVSVTSVHLLSGAIDRGLPDPDRPRAVKVYSQQVANLRKVFQAELDAGYRPYITGDFNIGYEADRKEKFKKFPFRQLGPKGLGLTSMWEGQELQAHGTHIDTDCPKGVKECGAYIDGIWSLGKPTKATVATDIKLSDHYAALADYSLPKEDLYVAPTGNVGFHAQDVAQAVDERDKPWHVKDDPIRFRLTGDLTHGFVQVMVGGTATEGEDYTLDTSTLYDNDFSNDHIDVLRIPDVDFEPPETVVLTLVDAVNTVVTVPAATATILNDD